METFSIEGSEHTPKIIFNFKEAAFEISGESRPENADKFFLPVINSLKEYEKYIEGNKLKILSHKKHVVIFKIEYFNSTSAKYILDIFKQIDILYSSGLDILVKWHYDKRDEDILESGKEFASLSNSKVPFEFVVN